MCHYFRDAAGACRYYGESRVARFNERKAERLRAARHQEEIEGFQILRRVYDESGKVNTLF